MENSKLETISNLFENKEIRSIWDKDKEDYYFSVVDVISAVVYVLALAFIIFLFVKIVISIIKFFLMKREHAGLEVEVNDMVEVRENIKIERTRNNEKLGKIRKKYKKYVEKKAKKGYELKKYQTPKERAEDIHKLMNEDIYELNAMYEKERYGHVND